MFKIGVVIPTYNRSKLLKRSIESVLKQSYQNFIICVVEDCSPDDTYKVMKEYELNNKIHYIRLKKNSGVNVSRNRAIDYLTSNEVDCDFITMLDDDYFIQETFSVLIREIGITGAKWLVCNRIYPSGEKITKSKKYGYLSYLEDKCCGTIVSGDAVKFISKQLIKGKRYPEGMRGREHLFFYY